MCTCVLCTMIYVLRSWLVLEIGRSSRNSLRKTIIYTFENQFLSNAFTVKLRPDNEQLNRPVVLPFAPCGFRNHDRRLCPERKPLGQVIKLLVYSGKRNKLNWKLQINRSNSKLGKKIYNFIDILVRRIALISEYM